MIAIVILGIGLLIVAGMFPVAWMKARDQVEATNVAVSTNSAETILKMKLRAAKHDPAREATFGVPNYHQWFDVRGTSLVGDLGIFPSVFPSGVKPTDGTNTRVHPINVMNMLVNPTGYSSTAQLIGESGVVEGLFITENPHRLESPFREMANIDNFPGVQGGSSYVGHQIRFEDRMIPSLSRWNSTASEVETDWWFSILRKRRYAWAALAKLNNGDQWLPLNKHENIAYTDPSAGGQPKRDTWDDPRYLTVYYVTLRRGQETSRFPQQAFGTPGMDVPLIPDPNVGVATVVQPGALVANRDTVFPTPWRVQVFVPNPTPPPGSGLPAEVEVNQPVPPSNGQTGRIVVDLLPRGAFMIDELNGSVYKVVRHTSLGGGNAAILTLDKEIPEADLWPAGDSSNYIANRDRLRTVWVFPPAVEPQRDAAGDPIFAGTQPVVGIEVRPMVLTP